MPEQLQCLRFGLTGLKYNNEELGFCQHQIVTQLQAGRNAYKVPLTQELVVDGTFLSSRP
jgi:hypothetical protein